jgi:hypothetical protein
MATDSRLYLQIAEGRLRLTPRGNLTDGVVKQILGAAQVGFRMFSVVVVDLREAGAICADTLAGLEEGLRQIVAAKKEGLPMEPVQWTLQTAATTKDACLCNGKCRDCACRPQVDQAAKKQVNHG